MVQGRDSIGATAHSRHGMQIRMLGGFATALAAGRSLTHCLGAVRRGGRLAYPGGVEPRPRKRRGLSIVTYDAVAGPREFDRLRRAAEAAKLQVPIAASYPLARAAEAHRRIAAGHVLGKIVLRVKR